MTTSLEPVAGLDGVFTARLGKLSCTALRLRDGSLCIYSPVAGLETSILPQADDLGPVSALLAPNHYHNTGLAAHVAAFPHAKLYCSSTAAPRLTKITGGRFDPLDALKDSFADGHVLHEPEGLKTGEVWVQITSMRDAALVVTDAFSAPMRPPGATSDRVTMLGTFPRYGVKDSHTYKAWAIDLITATAPTLLLPCHGSPVRSHDLASQLIQHIDALP